MGMVERVASRFLAAAGREPVHTEVRGDRIYVLGDTYSLKDDLKRKGFAWDPEGRGWWIASSRFDGVRGWVESLRQERHGAPVVQLQDVYSDGSGAPALVEHMGFTWSFDTLGDVRHSLVRGPGGAGPKSVARNRSVRESQAAYEKALARAVPPGWLEMNREMYRK